jgi:hypothetical protein
MCPAATCSMLAGLAIWETPAVCGLVAGPEKYPEWLEQIERWGFDLAASAVCHSVDLRSLPSPDLTCGPVEPDPFLCRRRCCLPRSLQLRTAQGCLTAAAAWRPHSIRQVVSWTSTWTPRSAYLPAGLPDPQPDRPSTPGRLPWSRPPYPGYMNPPFATICRQMPG